VAPGREPHAVHGGVDLRHAEDLFDLLGQRRRQRVDGLEAHAAVVIAPILVRVTDDDHGRPEQRR
jgi:hypothetical protein